jgi:hypothetical protein
MQQKHMQACNMTKQPMQWRKIKASNLSTRAERQLIKHIFTILFFVDGNAEAKVMSFGF